MPCCLDDRFRPWTEQTPRKASMPRSRLRAHLAICLWCWVTHDMTRPQLLADRMVVIDAGRMVATGANGQCDCRTPKALHAMAYREAAAMVGAVGRGLMMRMACTEFANPRRSALGLPRFDAALIPACG